MKTLHFECFAGISGDMTLGALVDLGVDPDQLYRELSKLGIGGWKLSFHRDERCGISGTRAHVDIDEHDHHGSEHHHTHDDEHHHSGNDSGHHHEHEHHHEHAHNSWKEIRSMIVSSGISENAKKRALDIFTRIAEAEAQVHGVSVDDVAFHEVGAIDSIIDIVGAAICLEILSPDRITASEIELGGGTVKCAHGILPVPAPATLLLCRNLPVKTGGFQKEMTTPTGAAILASCVDEFITSGSFTEIKTGYGIGSRKMDKPNVLRVSWRDEQNTVHSYESPWKTEELILIEANIDDMTGEAFGFLMDRLFEHGALDVTMTPCVMKKSRPSTVVSVLTGKNRLDDLRRTMFEQSSTIGFRETTVNRLSLERREKKVNGPFGAAGVKQAFLGGYEIKSKIEFEDRARVARENNLTLDGAERLIIREDKK